ncbi:MAG: sulfatase-like hydrolase/transferase [Phycisphaerae bacterium]|nr:sulfatase-like hydrolase/transferase [Phycisphaerae bacterium]
MNKSGKKLRLIIPVILLVCAGIWFAVHQRSSVPAIRHVVLISLDTCRADYLSCYGYGRETTPNIDALAKEGYLFSHSFTPIPLTLPAHTSMLTGTIPPYHGRHENKDSYFDPSHVTLAALFKAKGYRTGAFVGSQILNSSFGLDRGFDTYGDEFARKDDSERRGEEVNREAFSWLEEQKDNPVFLFLHYYDAHTTYDPPEPFASTFKESPYAGEIAYADHCIGEVIAKLKQLGMYESTLIIVTGDHGEMLGEHGETDHMYFIYQSAVHVPLIYKFPGGNMAQTIDDTTGIIDIVPTVCDLMGLTPPEEIQGESLTPYFSDTPPSSEDRLLYCESLYPTKYEANTLLGLVTKRWKYIQTTRPELYDLQKDPGEKTNLIATEHQRARIFKDHLAVILEKTVRQEKGQDQAALSREALKHLHSLGYVTSSNVKKDFSFDQSKDDPKDLIVFHREYRRVSNMLSEGCDSDIRALGDDLIKLRPHFFESYSLLFGIALNQKDYQNAIYFGEKSLELKPDNFNVHQILGFAYTQTKQYEMAVVHFERALECITPGQADSRAEQIQVYNQLGLLHSNQKKFDLAIVAFEKTIRLDPEQPAILNALSQALLSCRNPALRNPPRALELALKACGLTQSKEPEYLSTLAVAYATLNQMKEAVTVLENALVLAQSKGDPVLLAKLKKQHYLIKRALAGVK